MEKAIQMSVRNRLNVITKMPINDNDIDEDTAS